VQELSVFSSPLYFLVVTTITATIESIQLLVKVASSLIYKIENVAIEKKPRKKS
jgi:hypothetical protein